MKNWKNITISALAVIISAAAIGFYELSDGDMCGNEIFEELLSPDSNHKAVVFQRDCGATTGFSTQVSIINAKNELENTGGNIYISDGHPKELALKIYWLSGTELVIKKSLNGSEYKAKNNWGFKNKIKVRYGAGGS